MIISTFTFRTRTVVFTETILYQIFGIRPFQNPGTSLMILQRRSREKTQSFATVRCCFNQTFKAILTDNFTSNSIILPLKMVNIVTDNFTSNSIILPLKMVNIVTDNFTSNSIILPLKIFNIVHHKNSPF